MATLLQAINATVGAALNVLDGALSDLCDLIPADFADQGSGHTLTEGTAILNVPCMQEQIGGGGVQIFESGGTVAVKTHRIFMRRSAATTLIDRHYKLRMHANGLTPELIFEKPVLSRDSFAGFAVVLMTLSEGYRSPGVT